MIKFNPTLLILVFIACTSIVQNAYSQDTPGIEYGSNYIVFESDVTASNLGLWVLREPGDSKYYGGTTLAPMNENYLEFTGNTLNGGSATSPLTYTFTCPKTADYRLAMRMYQPLADGEAGDKRNDVYIKLTGNYTSACQYPKDILETNHKFWGRGVRVWGSCHSLEAHLSSGRLLDRVVYRLIEGEVYTFTMSGRAQGCSIDYILFFEQSISLNVVNIDIAEVNDPIYRPGLGLVDPTSLTLDPNPGTVRVGTSFELDVLAEPVNARKGVTWESSNDTILTVDENGIITAVGEIGESATITATSTETELEATSDVSIVEWYPITINSIELSAENTLIIEGSQTSVTATTLPKFSDNPSITWSSSDTDIATVDTMGKVSAISSGSVTIRATSDANETIFEQISLDIEAFVETFVEFDDENKYLTTSYYSDETLEVTCNYHAGNFATVSGGIKFWLREMYPTWDVSQETHNHVVTSYADTESGTATYSIPLTDVTPTNQLTAGRFYFLFISYTNSNGVSVNKGIHPINILTARSLSNGDSPGGEVTVIDDHLITMDNVILYPNPSDGLISIVGLAKGLYAAWIYDITGSAVANTIVTVNHDNVCNIDLHHLKNGQYSLVLEGNKTIKRFPIFMK